MATLKRMTVRENSHQEKISVLRIVFPEFCAINISNNFSIEFSDVQSEKASIAGVGESVNRIILP